MIKKVFIAGYGYTAQHLSTMLARDSIAVSSTTRNQVKLQRLEESLVSLMLLDPKKPVINISNHDFILISAPPNPDGNDPILELIKDQLIMHREKIKWIGYLSSTSVYGDHHGEWVNENSKANCPGERGKRRLKAEHSWISLFDKFRLPVHVFRLAGIYGPDRNSLVRILNGKNTSIIKNGLIFSRIHIEDICRALYHSMRNPTPGEIYNLADDQPCAPESVDKYAAKLLNKPPLDPIPFDQATTLHPLAKEFYQDSRKVSNEKFKEKFNFIFRYPSYKEGLNSLHRNI